MIITCIFINLQCINIKWLDKIFESKQLGAR